MSGLESQPLLPQHDYLPSDGDSENTSRYKRCRRRTAEALEASATHKFIILLIAVDACCVSRRPLIGYTILSDTCTPPEGGDAPVWLEVLSHISLAITGLFVIEIPLTIWALGWRNYWPFSSVPHAPLHFFDACVILGTFILEVVLRGRERELAALLVVLRLWRLVKLVGGVAVGAGEFQEEDAKQLAQVKQALQESNQRLKEAISENQQLRHRLRGVDASFDSIDSSNNQ